MVSFYEEINPKNKIADEAENAGSRASIDKWIFRLFLVLLGVMPLVVSAHTEEVISPLISNVDVLSSGVKGELFTHYKALIVLFVTIIAAILFLIKIFFMDGTIRKTILNYVLVAFVITIIASTIASPNISIALSGQYNRSDGAISWLCYVALMFIAMNIEYSKNFIRLIMYTMMPFVYINLFIITMNFYGKDLLQNYTWVQNLVSVTLPEGSSLSEGSQLLGTLNQWNYMSGMFAMMTVMYLAWAVTSKSWIEVILGAVTASIAILVMFMSFSTSGFLTVLVALPLLVIIVFRLEKKKQYLAAIAIFLIVTIPIFHNLAIKNEKIWNESFGVLLNNNPYHPESIGLLFNHNTVYASNQSFELPELPESSFSAGTGRLYIWEKTIGILKNRPLLGYGADSLTYNFPHYNIDARSGMADENTIVDKPHNLYVGILYGYGIVGLVAIALILVGVIFYLAIATFKSSSTIFILGLTSMAYFVQSMFNDSLPGTSGVAFIFIGMMLGIELLKRKESL